MLKNKTYLRTLFTILLVIAIVSVAYIIDFSKKYPIPLTSRISLDAKLKFILENIEPDRVDTIIVGSSIGLNNIQGSYLEKFSSKCNTVLNLSVYEATTLQVEQLLELTEAFPNLKRIIYSAQYSDFPHLKIFKEYDSKFLIKYIRKELNPFTYVKTILESCQDLKFCINRADVWKDEHQMSNKFTYLGFDSTGSVPLHIYGDDIIQHRWKNPHPGIMHSKSFAALERMSHKAKNSNIKFYLAHQPYRKPLFDSNEKVRNAIHYFDSMSNKALIKHDGKLIKLQELNLNDEYFADRTHLNDKGSIITAKAIGKFIDKSE